MVLVGATGDHDGRRQDTHRAVAHAAMLSRARGMDAENSSRDSPIAALATRGPFVTHRQSEAGCTWGAIEASWEEATALLDEAAGRQAGAVTFEFDTVDVTLDFDASFATVADILDERTSASVPLPDFLRRAASFGDDPSVGDSLAEMQRRPATYGVDGTGEARPTDATDMP